MGRLRMTQEATEGQEPIEFKEFCELLDASVAAFKKKYASKPMRSAKTIPAEWWSLFCQYLGRF